MSAPVLRLATRSSPLALWQAEHIAAQLGSLDAGCRVELIHVQTTGDARTDAPIAALGGQGVFVKEVQQAVLDGRADLAVHSAKDLPSVTATGLALAAVPARGDARDALVGRPLEALAPGSIVATGSARRRAQLTLLRPDLVFVELRGNIATRLAKVPDGGAIVMAAVALERLGLSGQVAEVLDPEVMVPQVAQGALAVETRADDEPTRELVSRLEDGASRRLVDVERAFLAELGAGCDLPVGAHATWLEGGGIRLLSFLAGPAGPWRGRSDGDAAGAITRAREEARQALALTA